MGEKIKPDLTRIMNKRGGASLQNCHSFFTDCMLIFFAFSANGCIQETNPEQKNQTRFNPHI